MPVPAPIDARLPGLDLSKPIYTRKAITTHGRTFIPGVEFPWRKLKYREEKVRQLYRSRHLTNEVPREIKQLPKLGAG